jgi:hypothetical protein
MLSVSGSPAAGTVAEPDLLVATTETLAPVAGQQANLSQFPTDDGKVSSPRRLTSTWKNQARSQTIEIDRRIRYKPADVAAILNCSYDTAIRRMRRMPGVSNLGVKQGRFTRGKAMLRILGSDLQAYLDDHKLS